jgi:hypothetical protein
MDLLLLGKEKMPQVRVNSPGLTGEKTGQRAEENKEEVFGFHVSFFKNTLSRWNSRNSLCYSANPQTLTK